MPHPKNRLKLTGDTHLPDIIDLELEDESLETTAAEEPRVYADGYVPSMHDQSAMQSMEAPQEMDHPEPPTTVEKVEQKVARQTSRTPMLMMGAGLLFGWMVMRVLRR